jgi:hypothetical protein
MPERIRLVAGVDAAYFNGWAIGAVAVDENMKIVIRKRPSALLGFRMFPHCSRSGKFLQLSLASES